MAEPISSDFQLTVIKQAKYFQNNVEDWDDLVSRSALNSIFQTSTWFKSWLSTLGKNSHPLIVEVRKNGVLLAGAALQDDTDQLSFLARGNVDYSDIVVDDSVDDATYSTLVELVLDSARLHAEKKGALNLTRLPARSRTLRSIESIPSIYSTRTASVDAPILNMLEIEEKLRKKSLIRHERKLAKQGQLVCDTTSSAQDTLPMLDEFFQQHIKRWQDTSSPSLFIDQQRRDFYVALAEKLGDAGWLRFSTVRLDDKLVAAHFGFLRAGVFTWYKPSYDPDWAKMSPGEVLIKHLLERARDEKADWFDFTIGNEPFKLRFATEVHKVYSLHVTASAAAALRRRMRLKVSQHLRKKQT